MTLKECVKAAADRAGITIIESFSDYDFRTLSHGKAVVFLSECECELLGGGGEEWQGIDGDTYRTEKQSIKLTVFGSSTAGVSQSESALDTIKMIFSSLSLNDSFCSLRFSVSEARKSAPHSTVLREAYISAVKLYSDTSKEAAI